MNIFNRYSGDILNQPDLKGIQSIFFIDAAKERLIHHMGRSYAEAVVACINYSFEGQLSRKEFPETFRGQAVMKLTIQGNERVFAAESGLCPLSKPCHEKDVDD